MVYEIARAAGLPKATPAFEAIYRAFLGQEKGPRAGWFLAFLDAEFVGARLREAAA
jgi:lysyl-tRNA synthetase class 1